jgi:outer membrane protein assembly factor BamB
MLTNLFGSVAQNIDAPSPSPNGTGGLADSPWPMFRQNPNHTGLSPYDTSGNNGQLRWNCTTGGGIWATPAISSDGTIYIVSDDRNLYAIYPNGTKKWSVYTGGREWSSPAIGSDGTIYVGSGDYSDYKVYAINPDGILKWSFSTGYIVYSSPIISALGTIYIGSSDYNLYAIYPDGSQKWSFPTGDEVRSSPAIGSDGTIYIGSNDNKLYAINPDGSEKWNFTTHGHVYSSPAIGSDGTIYVGSCDNKLYAINPDGTEKWSFITDFWIFSSPAIGSDGTIYVGSFDNNLYAINPDGSEKWNFTTGANVYSSPAIGADGTIYFGTPGGKVYAVDQNGKQKWVLTTDEVVRSSPAIGLDGTIYIGSGYQLCAIGMHSIPPIADAGLDQILNEGNTIQFNASVSNDPDGTIETYEWDFDASDGLWWVTGETPDSTSPAPTHIYGDDSVFVVTLRVTDNDNLSASDTCNITVQNVDPTVSIESVTMNLEIGLRVAGRKYNDVGMTLYENGTPIGYVSIERMPGSPDDQMAWIPLNINFSKSYSAVLTYTPENPPNIGANPVWIYLKPQNGSIKKIHHTFNVQQSKKRDSDHWNHIEPWEVDLSNHFVGLPFEVVSHVTDPGSDDELLTYSYGSQIVNITYLNNPPNPDPYPSPELNPVDLYDISTLIYEGPETVYLDVIDDDGGTASDSFIL